MSQLAQNIDADVVTNRSLVRTRERLRVVRELAVIAITCAGVMMLYLFYLYRFGNPFIVSRVEAGAWTNTLSVANLFSSVRIYGFAAVLVKGFSYNVVPVFLIDTLIVVATVIFLLKKDLALQLTHSSLCWSSYRSSLS